MFIQLSGYFYHMWQNRGLDISF